MYKLGDHLRVRTSVCDFPNADETPLIITAEHSRKMGEHEFLEHMADLIHLTQSCLEVRGIAVEVVPSSSETSSFEIELSCTWDKDQARGKHLPTEVGDAVSNLLGVLEEDAASTPLSQVLAHWRKVISQHNDAQAQEGPPSASMNGKREITATAACLSRDQIMLVATAVLDACPGQFAAGQTQRCAQLLAKELQGKPRPAITVSEEEVQAATGDGGAFSLAADLRKRNNPGDPLYDTVSTTLQQCGVPAPSPLHTFVAGELCEKLHDAYAQAEAGRATSH